MQNRCFAEGLTQGVGAAEAGSLYCQWQPSERGIAPAEVKAEIEAGMALREMPTDADVAEAAVFLASERSRFAFA